MTFDHRTLAELADKFASDSDLYAMELMLIEPDNPLRRGYLAGKSDTYRTLALGIRDYLDEYPDPTEDSRD